MNNPVVLSYHESLLRQSDIDILRGPCWLNDTIISFYFEYLEVDRFKRNTSLLFVPPQVTQCIKMAPISELDVFLKPLGSDKREFIFFALNNNEETESAGGSHWSLLVFSRPEKIFLHFDSSRGSNQDQALDMGHKLMHYFGIANIGRVSEPLCLQQTNSYDCGIYVLCYAEHLAAYALSNGEIEGAPSLEKSEVRQKREEILNIVDFLRHR